jgi:hypothetical protein
LVLENSDVSAAVEIPNNPPYFIYPPKRPPGVVLLNNPCEAGPPKSPAGLSYFFCSIEPIPKNNPVCGVCCFGIYACFCYCCVEIPPNNPPLGVFVGNNPVVFAKNDPVLKAYYFLPPKIGPNNPPEIGVVELRPPNESLGAS